MTVGFNKKKKGARINESHRVIGERLVEMISVRVLYRIPLHPPAVFGVVVAVADVD